MDAVAGFGDGVYEAITLGIGDLQDVCDAAGIDGEINKCSGEYGWSSTAGNVVGGAAFGGGIERFIKIDKRTPDGMKSNPVSSVIRTGAISITLRLIEATWFLLYG